MSQHSAACCSIPAVISKGYEQKGKYTQVGSWKSYVTGDESSKHGIFVIYDIFGYFPQTIQGADILAYGNKERSTLVVMPDILENEYADISWFPPDTAEKGQKLGDFFKGPAEPGKTAAKVTKILAELKSAYPSVASWALMGYCWGGKVTVLSSFEGTGFTASAIIHPAMVDPADAPKVTIPIAVLPSGDEDKDAVTKFGNDLKVKHTLEWFPDVIHGWMAARSDLEDPKVKSEYERGYKLLLNFFHDNL